MRCRHSLDAVALLTLFAASAAGAENLPMPSKVKAETFSGLLRRIAHTDRELILASSQGGRERYTTVQVPEGTRITRDQREISLDELRDEEPARVEAEQRDGRWVALWVHVGSGVPPSAVRAERETRPAAPDGTGIGGVRQDPDESVDGVKTARRVLQMVEQAPQIINPGAPPRFPRVRRLIQKADAILERVEEVREQRESQRPRP